MRAIYAVIAFIGVMTWAWRPDAGSSLPDAESHLAYQVLVIPVSGEVGPAMAAFIERALSEGDEYPNPLFVLEMDTFGGRVDSALRIVDTLLSVPRGKTLAFVKKRAISAGALIALSCRELVMVHSTTIGDCAPIIFSNEGPKMLGEKFQSPLRAKFRSLAKRNGYPETLAEAMVSPDLAVYKLEKADGTSLYMDSVAYEELPEEEREQIISKKTIVGKDKLLTMDDQEAVDFGFSKMNVASLEEVLREKKLAGDPIIRFEESWSEQLVRLITKLAPILMMLGFAGLYIEIQTPGFGIPGIAGVICLALAFWGQHMVGLANHTELLIFALGVMFLGLEIFVLPGFGVAGAAGILLVATGMILSFQDFVIPSPEIPWEAELLKKNIISVVGSLLGACVLIFLLFRYALPGVSSVMAGPYLSATLEASHVDSGYSARVSVGDRGVVTKALRPSGSVRIGNEIYDVISEGEFMDKGTPVEVMEIQSNRIMVTGSPANEQ
ncbi:MAG: serine protease [Deltaproteobacteria bacterium]|nr:MAG: serine protease [Deltaproteobacteria bacterium]